MSGQRGFTFIELVTVIALMGILSVVALPRLIGSDSFGGEEVARQFIAGARLAQQQAMAHTNGAVSLNVARDGAGYNFAVTFDNAGAPQTLFGAQAKFAKVNVQVVAGGLNAALGVGQSLQFSFTPRSDLSAVVLAGAPGSINGGVALTIDGQQPSSQQAQLCVAASGYAHRGTCL